MGSRGSHRLPAAVLGVLGFIYGRRRISAVLQERLSFKIVLEELNKVKIHGGVEEQPRNITHAEILRVPSWWFVASAALISMILGQLVPHSHRRSC